jgi:hypothetical protein
MGIASAGKCIYKSTSVDVNELYSILEDRRNESTRIATNTGTTQTPTTSPRRPSVDIDASQVAFRFQHFSCGPAGYILAISKAILLCGIDVTIVGDPPKRHHSKRATIKRKARCERSRLNCIKLQAQLTLSLQANERPSDTIIAAMEKKMATERSQSEKSRPCDFTNRLP